MLPLLQPARAWWPPRPARARAIPRVVVLAGALAAGLAGCGTPAAAPAAQAGATAATPAPAPALPQVQGVVEEVDASHRLLVLRHEEIPNLGMAAMTMAFEVADPALLAGLAPGDRVRFQADLRHGEVTLLSIARQP